MTTFNNASHTSLFLTGTDLTSSERIHVSDMVMSALIACGLMDTKVTAQATAPADLTTIWLDTGSAPADLKAHDGTSWVKADFTDIWRFQDFVSRSGDVMTGQLEMHDGTAAAPAITFSGDSTTGFYRDGSGKLCLSYQGNTLATFDANGMELLGTTTEVNTTNLTVEDNIVVLNSGETGAGVTAGTAGISVKRGSSNDAVLRFNESNDLWEVGVSPNARPILTELTQLGSGTALIKQLNGNKIEARSIQATDGVKLVLASDLLSLSLNTAALTLAAPVGTADHFIYYDVSAGAHKKATAEQIVASVAVPVGSI